MAVVNRIGPASAFKVGLVAYGLLGLILGVLCGLMIVAGSSFAKSLHVPFGGAYMGLFAVILCPILYGILGGIFAVIAALIYNLASGWVGGLEVDIR